MSVATDICPIGGAEYAEVLDVLHREARALDDARFDDWLGFLSVDVRYRMPVRLERMPKDGPGFVDDMDFYIENHSSLRTRVGRLQTEQAWAEQPGSRARHFLSNFEVRRGSPHDGASETFSVVSNFMVTRTRSDLPYDLFTGERRDVLRREDGELRLLERLILLDQTMLLSYNLSIFI